MDLSRFFETYLRTLDGLPSVLRAWSRTDSELRNFYRDEILLLLAERASIAEELRARGQQQNLFRLASMDRLLIGLREKLVRTMGVSVLDMLAPDAAVDEHAASDTINIDDTDYSLAA